MPDRCTMYAPPGGGDGEDPPDTFPDNWTPVESNVKCRLVSTIRSAAEREVAGSIRGQGDFEIVKPYSSLRPKQSYRIRVTTLGRDFDVIGVRDGSQPTAWHTEVNEVTQ